MKNNTLKYIICLFVLCFAAACPLAKSHAVEYTSQALRDPFQSPFERVLPPGADIAVNPALAKYKVQGMVWDSQRPQAIINDVVLNIGDVFEGIEILNIRREGIYVLYEGNRSILKPRIK